MRETAIFIRLTSLIKATSRKTMAAQDQLDTNTAVDEKLTIRMVVLLRNIFVDLDIDRFSIKTSSDIKEREIIIYISIVIYRNYNMD